MIADSTIILAAYGRPGVLGAQTLLDLGVPAAQLSFLTYPADERNQDLRAFADEQGIACVTHAAGSTAAAEWVAEQQPTALFSLHYRDRLPEGILSLPTHGCVNLHPSLLPAYRGCFSVPWVIINGETETGFTYHYMEEQFDTGHILRQERISIAADDTAHTLFERQVDEGLATFAEVVKQVIEEQDPGVPQVGEGSYYPRTLPYDGVIDLTWSDEQVDRFIRAMIFPPHAGAVAMVNGAPVEVHSLSEYKALFAPA